MAIYGVLPIINNLHINKIKMNNQTIEKLKTMRLGAMAHLHLQHVQGNRFEGMTCDEYLAILTDHQWEDRENKKIERLLNRQASGKMPTLLISVILPTETWIGICFHG